MKAKGATKLGITMVLATCSVLLGLPNSHANGAGGIYGVAIQQWVPGDGHWSGLSPGDPLGPPDYDVVDDAYGIGRGGILILEMAVPFIDGPGVDLTVYEYGAGAGGTNDSFEVWVSSDDNQYYFVGPSPGDATDFEFAAVGLTGPFSYVKVVDTDTTGQHDGADIDAVEAYTPEPATLSLLALGGLAMLRRRRELK